MADDAVARLLDDAAGRLAAYGYLLTGSQDAGDKLVQDAVVRVFSRRRVPRSLAAGERAVTSEMRVLASRASAVGELGAGAVGAALAQLTRQERVAIVLRHHDHLQVSEISSEMRASHATVERLLVAATSKLERNLGPIDPVLDPVPVVTKSAR